MNHAPIAARGPVARPRATPPAGETCYGGATDGLRAISSREERVEGTAFHRRREKPRARLSAMGIRT
jgi:hypothetical protein